MGSPRQRGCLCRRPGDESNSFPCSLFHPTQRSGLKDIAGTGMSKTFEVLRPEGLLAGFYLREGNGVEAGNSLIDIVSSFLSKRTCLGICAGGSR
jgi:hypothetical protein